MVSDTSVMVQLVATSGRMMDCRNVCIVIISIATFVLHGQPAVSATLGVMLNSSLNEDLTAHDQQDVFFTCAVQGSSNVILEWSSAEYIGQGGFPLQLLSLNGTGTNVSSTTHPSTYAVRRSVSIENELTEITSDLRIIASLQYPMGTVTCSASANGASSSRNISFQTRALPSQATEVMTFNITTIPDTNDITTKATATETTDNPADSTSENQQQSCTRNSTGEAVLGFFLALSLLANVIAIPILIIAIHVCIVRKKRSRPLNEAATPTSDSHIQSSAKPNDNETSGSSPTPKTSHSSPEQESKQKKGLLGALHGKIQQLGLENCLSLNKNSDVHVQSEETLIPALTALYKALRDGPHSKFKDAIQYLCDDLHFKKVPDEVLNTSLEKFRETHVLQSSNC